MGAAVEAAAGQYHERIESWAETVRKDSEIGGEKLEENLSYAKATLEAFGNDEFGKILSAPTANNPEGLGLGNHPEMLRFMYRVGKALGDSKLIEGDASAVEDENSLKRMYPSMPQFHQAS